MAEQFGEVLYGHRLGLRNADNNFKLNDVSSRFNDVSQAFPGAIFNFLSDMFRDYTGYERYVSEESLFRLGKYMTLLVFCSPLGEKRNATFRDIAQKMIEIEPVEHWKPLILRRIEEREVLSAQSTAAEATIYPGERLSYAGCCGRLTHPDYGS